MDKDMSTYCRLFSTWVGKFGAVAMVLMLLAGCGGSDDGGREHDDDFLVSFPSPLEIFIRRPFDRPFEVLEIGVSPFIDPVFGPEAYVLAVSGIAFLDGAEIIFEARDVASIAFIDPLRERVIDVLIACDCFVDYVILLSPFGETTITFD
jgi:hypothetical protein